MAHPDAPRRPPSPDAAAPPAGPSGTLFASLPATVWTTDTELTLTFIAGVLLRRLHIGTDRLLGRRLQDLVLDGREDHPLIQGHLTAVAGHETTVRIEWGGEVYSARLAPLRTPDGDIAGVVGVQQQIAWQPEDEGTLRESDARLRRAIEANIVGIAFGNEQGQITDANEAFLTLIGATRDELAADGLAWPDLIPVEYHQRQLGAIEEVRQTGRCRPFECQIIRKDGRRVDVLIGGARLSAQRREGVAFVMDLSRTSDTVRGLRAELAGADVLVDAPDADAAMARVLAGLRDHLGWQAAFVWQAADGRDRIVARLGTTGATDAALEAAARRAVAGGDTRWSAGARALAVPLGTPAGRATVLLLVSAPDRTPDTTTIAASRAIGLRLARALGRLAR